MPVCHLKSEESLWIFNLSHEVERCPEGNVEWSGEKCLWLELRSWWNKPWSWKICIIINLTGKPPLNRHCRAWSDILNVRWEKEKWKKEYSRVFSTIAGEVTFGRKQRSLDVAIATYCTAKTVLVKKLKYKYGAGEGRNISRKKLWIF